MRWYYDAYTDSEWTLVSHSTSQMTLTKNNAQTRLTFKSIAGTPAKTDVLAIVGVGTQVLSTQ
jgi:hypothetical protein